MMLLPLSTSYYLFRVVELSSNVILLIHNSLFVQILYWPLLCNNKCIQNVNWRDKDLVFNS